MKWFSFKGIMDEAKKVKWPKRKELVSNTSTAVAFILVFAAFFVASDFLITLGLRAIGVLS